VSQPSFAARYGPWALVAGGSDGLGAAFAGELAGRGVSLVLAARRPDQLQQTAAALREAHGVQVLAVPGDLGEPGAVDRIASAIGEREIGLVIANAALAPAGPFRELPAADAAAAVDLNCRAAVLLASRFLPPMAGRGHGGLVLVSSLAGLQGVANLAVYSASKAFLISLAESLWAESRAAGVDVLAACPGAVSTPGYQQAARRSAPGTSTPQQVARLTLDALGRGFRVVPGRLNRVSAVALGRLMPRRAALAVFNSATAASLHEETGPPGTGLSARLPDERAPKP
jgi:short-subunit dehydrogenase